MLESEAYLYVCHGIVVLGKCSVVDVGILREDGEVLGDVVVQARLVLCLHAVRLAVVLVHVVASLGIELLADDRGDDEGIDTLRLVAYFFVQVAILGIVVVEVVDALGEWMYSERTVQSFALYSKENA